MCCGPRSRSRRTSSLSVGQDLGAALAQRGRHVHAVRVGRERAQPLGQRRARPVGVGDRHTAHPARLVEQVDGAHVGEPRRGQPGHALQARPRGRATGPASRSPAAAAPAAAGRAATSSSPRCSSATLIVPAGLPSASLIGRADDADADARAVLAHRRHLAVPHAAAAHAAARPRRRSPARSGRRRGRPAGRPSDLARVPPEQALGLAVPGTIVPFASVDDDRRRRPLDQLAARDARERDLGAAHVRGPPAGTRRSPLSADGMRQPSRALGGVSIGRGSVGWRIIYCCVMAAIDGTVSLRVLGSAPATAVAEPLLLALGARAGLDVGQPGRACDGARAWRCGGPGGRS